MVGGLRTGDVLLENTEKLWWLTTSFASTTGIYLILMVLKSSSLHMCPMLQQPAFTDWLAGLANAMHKKNLHEASL